MAFRVIRKCGQVAAGGVALCTAVTLVRWSYPKYDVFATYAMGFDTIFDPSMSQRRQAALDLAHSVSLNSIGQKYTALNMKTTSAGTTSQTVHNRRQEAIFWSDLIDCFSDPLARPSLSQLTGSCITCSHGDKVYSLFISGRRKPIKFAYAQYRKSS